MPKDYLDFISTVVIGGVGLAITIIYNKHTRQIAQDQIFKELFTSFNARYDNLNNVLYEILEKCPQYIDYTSLPLDQLLKYKRAMNDYFILCAEEFFWYKKGRIDEKVWRSWQIGMHKWYEVHTIREEWLYEVEKNGKASFYITDEDEFFPTRIKK